ncbi:hypothetical protein [Ferrovum sp.]|uniref:hypothetical protein n=1 Tax=Ferrovum sp. TaxID=2609467 RepID=UPI00261BBECA|nr:hypothetical protein [Ferrovum sp.]
MEMKIKKVGNNVEVEVGAWGNEHLADTPVLATYCVSSNDMIGILKASELCRENGWLHVAMSDSRVEYLFEDDLGNPTMTADQKDFRVDSDRMVVSDRAVQFEAYEKYTGLEVWVESVRISDLEAAMKGEGAP